MMHRSFFIGISVHSGRFDYQARAVVVCKGPRFPAGFTQLNIVWAIRWFALLVCVVSQEQTHRLMWDSKRLMFDLMRIVTISEALLELCHPADC